MLPNDLITTLSAAYCTQVDYQPESDLKQFNTQRVVTGVDNAYLVQLKDVGTKLIVKSFCLDQGSQLNG